MSRRIYSFLLLVCLIVVQGYSLVIAGQIVQHDDVDELADGLGNNFYIADDYDSDSEDDDGYKYKGLTWENSQLFSYPVRA